MSEGETRDDFLKINGYIQTGGQQRQTGPALVLYKDNIMFRTEYKHLIYEDTNTISNSRGSEFSIGTGITF